VGGDSEYSRLPALRPTPVTYLSVHDFSCYIHKVTNKHAPGKDYPAATRGGGNGVFDERTLASVRRHRSVFIASVCTSVCHVTLTRPVLFTSVSIKCLSAATRSARPTVPVFFDVRRFFSGIRFRGSATLTDSRDAPTTNRLSDSINEFRLTIFSIGSTRGISL